MASADAVLRGSHDNVIHRIQLPLAFDIKGKVKQPVIPRKALGRAVRGVSAQQRSKYCTVHLDNPLEYDTHTYDVPPDIAPTVSLPARDNRQTSGSVLHLFSSPTSGNGDQQPSLVDTTAEIPPAVDPFLWDINPALPVNAPPLIMTSPSRHALQPCELGFNLHDMGKVFL